MRAVVKCGAFHVFGSGSASASLRSKNGKRLNPLSVSFTDNGFVGWVEGVFNLPPGKIVKWRRAAYPGGTYEFEGAWEDLVNGVGVKRTS